MSDFERFDPESFVGNFATITAVTLAVAAMGFSRVMIENRLVNAEREARRARARSAAAIRLAEAFLADHRADDDLALALAEDAATKPAQ